MERGRCVALGFAKQRRSALGAGVRGYGRSIAILLALATGLFGAACGGGPQLTNLRCRETPCQDPEDPFKLRLAVDFTDPSGTLGEGNLELLLNGGIEDAVSLGDLFTAQSISATTTEGTLQVDEDIALSSVSSGEAFTVGLRAHNGAGHDSNTPELSLTVTVGGGN